MVSTGLASRVSFLSMAGWNPQHKAIVSGNPDTPLPLVLHLFLLLLLLLSVSHVMYVCVYVVCGCTAMSVETRGGCPVSLSYLLLLFCNKVTH